MRVARLGGREARLEAVASVAVSADRHGGEPEQHGNGRDREEEPSHRREILGAPNQTAQRAVRSSGGTRGRGLDAGVACAAATGRRRPAGGARRRPGVSRRRGDKRAAGRAGGRRTGGRTQAARRGRRRARSPAAGPRRVPIGRPGRAGVPAASASLARPRRAARAQSRRRRTASGARARTGPRRPRPRRMRRPGERVARLAGEPGLRHHGHERDPRQPGQQERPQPRGVNSAPNHRGQSGNAAASRSAASAGTAAVAGWPGLGTSARAPERRGHPTRATPGRTTTPARSPRRPEPRPRLGVPAPHDHARQGQERPRLDAHQRARRAPQHRRPCAAVAPRDQREQSERSRPPCLDAAGGIGDERRP